MSIWGKIIGGTAGFALGGPIGAILGVMVGGSFDKKAKRFTNSNPISDQHKQNIFALSKQRIGRNCFPLFFNI